MNLPPIFEAVRVLLIAAASFVIAFGITPVIARAIERLGMKKQLRSAEAAPVYARLHEKKVGTPTMGGVIVWATVAILATMLFLLAQLFDGAFAKLNFIDRAQTYLPLAAMLIAAVFGLADDLLGVLRIGANGGGLKVRHKLIMYSVVALLGALWFYYRLDWDVLQIPFYGAVAVNWWYIPIFMFIIIASAFSANEADGLDGLAGGVMLFAFLALTAVAFVLGRFHLAAFSGAVVGALLAFLWFNIYPARFFMGDTGSMSLGITMGVIAMLTNTALYLPLFAPILVIESLSVIAQLVSKRVRGKKLFISTPIHHHFEALGWPETKVTMRFWIISAVGTAVGLALFFLNRLLYI
ncbi:MAG: phospho-N-acetylmuramoyl-pentapeptide-transferase [Candidatus Harrisonbacteria bacterium]|nr:phospho-N-acetylmuramoyl-pentapeptide-transferase [Candidatus Harrisonbacteria bacterium]MBI3114815.1 phospho-N-acetylmuramoyl-pentapeptide-transferase [Candidatus Harrisonbacteria bacterium]